MNAESSDKPAVSVVIPVYNRADSITGAVNSVVNQTFRDCEIIIVDDGSTDNTRTVVESLIDDRVRYVRHDMNKGANAARNTGVKLARGRYIAFQDSDDRWRSDKLERQVAACSSSNAKVCFCAFNRHVGDASKKIPKDSYRVPSGLSDLQQTVLRGSFISCQTLFVDRELILSLEGFDESLPRLQDWELCLRLAQATPFYFLDEILVDVNLSHDSISRDLSKYIRAAEMILGRHRELFTSDPIAEGILRLNVAFECLGEGYLGGFATQCWHALLSAGYRVMASAWILFGRR
ncbi:MAG: glycosyltransferase [Gammaproteobacteria bacterium]|nr:glycosyltransferase [Gammaproteobacteria bacterium]